MGVVVTRSTMPGGVTPACNCCGIALCWDISEEEYAQQKAFWDEWICADCNGGDPMSLKSWIAKNPAPEKPKPADDPFKDFL